MDQTNKDIEHAEKYCLAKGERLTKNRKLVLSALIKKKKAVSAYDLVDYCKSSLDVVIPVMSVYRVLDFLQSLGLAHKLSLANKYVACSHIVCRHTHVLSQFLICDKCQRVEEMDVEPSAISDLQTAIQKTGFHLSSPQLEISGICEKCFSAEKT